MARNVVAAGLMSMGLWGCGGVEPRLSSIQANVFDVGCNAASCHGAGMEGGLDLRAGASFASLVNAVPKNAAAADSGFKRVTPGDLAKSLLYVKLQHDVRDEYGGRMPPLGPVLEAAEVDAIRRWILDGAKDD